MTSLARSFNSTSLPASPTFDCEAVLARSRHKTFMLVDHSTPGWGLLGTAEATLEGDRSVAKYAPGSSLVVPFTFEVLPKKG